MTPEFTHKYARYYVIAALGDYADEFNIDACVDDLYCLAGGSYNFRCIDPDDFNGIIQKHGITVK